MSGVDGKKLWRIREHGIMGVYVCVLLSVFSKYTYRSRPAWLYVTNATHIHTRKHKRSSTAIPHEMFENAGLFMREESTTPFREGNGKGTSCFRIYLPVDTVSPFHRKKEMQNLTSPLPFHATISYPLDPRTLSQSRLGAERWAPGLRRRRW